MIYKGMDLCKLMASCLIVLLHATETQSLIPCEIKFVFTRFAVPFFFIASGFFLAKGLEFSNAQSQSIYIRKYLTHLFWIFVVWALLIYGPFTIYSYLMLPKYENCSIIYLTFVVLRKLFIVGPGPYWYLIALMESVIILYFLRNRLKIMIVLMLVCFGLLLVYTVGHDFFAQFTMFNIFIRIIDFLYSWEFNFITYGIPFCCIGFLIFKYDYKISCRLAFMLFMLFTILRVREFHASQVDFSTRSVIYIPQAISFFFFSLSLNVKISDITSKTCRQLSSFIYFSHAIILYNILNPILINSGFIYTFSPIAILPKTILTIVICFAIFVKLKKSNNLICKLLING